MAKEGLISAKHRTINGHVNMSLVGIGFDRLFVDFAEDVVFF